MKRKLDVYLLYFSYVVELISIFSARIINNYESTHTISVSEAGKPIYGNMKIYLDISKFSYYLFFVIIILYILFILLKLKNKEPINLLKNTILSLIIFLIELINTGFIFHFTNLLSSSSLLLVCVVLITNLILYLKYKNIIQNGILKKIK
mgnify:CR=1 FL=1